jgi:hypothetical protein
MMKVVQSKRGWDVIANGKVRASFTTNAQAWRYVDRQQCEPVSRVEHVSAWVMGKIGIDDPEASEPQLKRPPIRDRLRRKRRKR